MRQISHGASDAPRQLFASTPAQRTTLARRQFFEEGVRPSGLVGEAVIQSWMRCRRAHVDTRRVVTFEAVTPSRLHSVLTRNHDLILAARQELAAMERSLAGTDSRVLLTDSSGVLIHVTHLPATTVQPVLRQTARVGVNLAEHAVGTTAPGIVTRTGVACTVDGGEHYLEHLAQMQCAAAPIRDVHGQLAGVLDLTVEARRFGFDAASMVGLYATTIENRLLEAQSGRHLILRFQANPGLLGTPLEAMAGIAPDGTIAWLNDAGARLIGRLPEDMNLRGVAGMLGHELESLLRLGRCSSATPLRLASGLGVWVRAQLKARDGIDFKHAVAFTSPAVLPEPEAAPASQADAATADTAGADEGEGGFSGGTLRAHNFKLVAEALAAHGGNVSRAARQLGISRGALYRRMAAGEAAPLGERPLKRPPSERPTSEQLAPRAAAA